MLRRIIPTRVGTSIPDEIVFVTGGDHPHACGDKIRRTTTQALPMGSSPRVWGQERRPVPHRLSKGIIPTRVGTSSGRKGGVKMT